MPPKKVLNYAFGRLMAAYKECCPYDPAGELSVTMFTSTNGTQYGSTVAFRAAVKDVAVKCNRWLDQYPAREFEQKLASIIGDVKDSGVSPTAASQKLLDFLTSFFEKLDQPGLWELVIGVTGIADGQRPFSVGPCDFQIMDSSRLHLWRQRMHSGRYDAPPGTPAFLDRVGMDRQLLGQWVASVRVHAADSAHAQAKARFRLEETLNVLRHEGFYSMRAHRCVRVGVGRLDHWDDSSFCIRIDGNWDVHMAGTGCWSGFTVHEAGLTQAWPAIRTLVEKELCARSELERRVMTALEWVGQSALAPLGPVRLVSLMTALEILVLCEHEALGKRSKLSSRVGRLVASVPRRAADAAVQADRLYIIRNRCLHDGMTQVDDADIELAHHLVDVVITALLTKEPYCASASLANVLALIEPSQGPGYEI